MAAEILHTTPFYVQLRTLHFILSFDLLFRQHKKHYFDFLDCSSKYNQKHAVTLLIDKKL